MRPNRKCIFAIALVSPLSGIMITTASAQHTYPTKSVRLIVPFVPGGITDLHARTLADRMAVRLNQPVVVDNRAGAGGRIGTVFAARSPADGYTLTIMNGAINGILPALIKDLPYDTLRDFQPIAKTVFVCPMLIVHPSIPANSLSDLVDYARARPGQINLGTPGTGNSAHILGEQLMKRTGIKLTHVPYKGEGAVMNDLIAGHVQMTFFAAAAPYVAAGQVKAIATTCPKRSIAFPETPTVAESGFAELTAEGWQGVGAPAGTPSSIVELLSKTIREVLAEPAVVQRLASGGLSVGYLGPEESRKFIGNEMDRWKRAVTDLGIKID
jgi:tripartite-type tricarboxylate transporter receptor subunit TctC